MHEDPFQQLASARGGDVVEDAGQDGVAAERQGRDPHTVLRADHALAITMGKRALPGGGLTGRLGSQDRLHGATVTAV